MSTSDEQLPVQAPVEQPILCSPFYEPDRHWVYNKEGKAEKMPGRRPATYWWTTQKTGTLQQQLEGVGMDFGGDDLPLVNALREDVKRWRKADYENATQVTKQLFRHWWRKDRPRRLFFCQLEAVETVVYLTEILASGRRTRWKPAVSAEDYGRLLRGERPELATAMGADFFPRMIDPPAKKELRSLVRYGSKMATGSGKTVVMAMLIAWAFCNRARVPGDTRFADAVLVCCPNLTVRERLQVLRPELGKASYYEEFDLVPARLRPLLNQGKVLILNWHQLQAESEHVEAGSSYAVVRKGEESPQAFSKRVLGDLAVRGPILVLNDEAHHAWRPGPGGSTRREQPKNEDGEFEEVTSAEAQEATVWVEGLDRINNSVGIQACIDLSATPFYLDGSGHIPGSPFPWLVSDFGLVDAIESGITKVPRLPVSDETGRPDPQFFRLWDYIKDETPPGQKVKGKPRPEAVWMYGEAAFTTLASEWKERFDYHRDARPGQQFIPPVLIVVCDNVNIAQYFFEKISGESEEEVVNEEGKRVKVRRYQPDTVPFPDLANTEDRQGTIRIDTKLLAEADVSEGSSRSQEAEKLRELIANVGRSGTEGEHVRCVVSVQMLTEGWDANNVTQILGLRAFGSQLLCEQVVGRGLRRINYDFDPDTERLSPEYVDVFGIPFSVIPFKGRPKEKPEPEDRPKNHVKAIPDRRAYEIVFPRVEGYVLDLRRPAIRCDVGAVEHLEIRPLDNPTETFVMPQVGIRNERLGSIAFQTERLTREEFYAQTHLQTILFDITRQIVNRLAEGKEGVHPAMRSYSRQQLFPQVLRVVRDYSDSRIHWNGVDEREIGLERYTRVIVERLSAAIEPDTDTGEAPLLPVIDRFSPKGTSADVDFVTTRECSPAQKSHVGQVVLDTRQWERSIAYTLESLEVVLCYVRNDHLDFSIPYEYLGVTHAFFPDFIVKLKSGTKFVLEIKGQEGDQERAKFEAARRWCSAVNNWGKMGRWMFHINRDPNALRSELSELNDQND